MTEQRLDIGFPLRLDERGRVATVSYERHVYELIEQLLFTMPGERVNRPEFGTRIRELVFERPGSERLEEARFQIQNSLNQWLGEVIAVEGVTVEHREGKIEVLLQYRILNTNHSTNEVFSL
ncbi:MAG: GPW/gp25 family protein [Proteobacteria bacterium]|nr:GPW/gp25 family protein [Pseudomonadota bacterium]